MTVPIFWADYPPPPHRRPPVEGARAYTTDRPCPDPAHFLGSLIWGRLERLDCRYLPLGSRKGPEHFWGYLVPDWPARLWQARIRVGPPGPWLEWDDGKRAWYCPRDG